VPESPGAASGRGKPRRTGGSGTGSGRKPPSAGSGRPGSPAKGGSARQDDRAARGGGAAGGGRSGQSGQSGPSGRSGQGGHAGRSGQGGHAGRSGGGAGSPAQRSDRGPTDTRRERAPRRSATEVVALPADITGEELDPDVRRQLRTLPKGLAEEVAKRLVAAGRFLEEDPELAHRHACEATRMASRVAAVREANGLTAYSTGRWAQARSELRAARRLSGSDEFLAILADCERGLGKPERALELAGSPEAARLDKGTRVELRIVASGARRDLGQLDAAVVTLQCPELRDESKPWSSRLRYAYADALLAAGRRDDAVDWFGRAARADPDGLTDAQERLEELDGVVFGDPSGFDGSSQSRV